VKAVVQRVNGATLETEGRAPVGIGSGLVVLAALVEGDTEHDREWMADKLAHLRIFPDDAGRMNRSVVEVAGSVLLVSNFTVAGDARRGRRPSFAGAMDPSRAREAFDALVGAVRSRGVEVRTGHFGEHMHVTIRNDGPVTLVLDSRA
jgi:D-aminoacyl-tRNA deacylase